MEGSWFFFLLLESSSCLKFPPQVACTFSLTFRITVHDRILNLVSKSFAKNNSSLLNDAVQNGNTTLSLAVGQIRYCELYNELRLKKSWLNLRINPLSVETISSIKNLQASPAVLHSILSLSCTHHKTTARRRGRMDTFLLRIREIPVLTSLNKS
jgi:hypothetical protein